MRLPYSVPLPRPYIMLYFLAWICPALAQAQSLALADRAPRFLAPSPSHGGRPVEIDVSASKLLQRVVSLNLERPTVGRMLQAIQRQTGLRFYYAPDVIAPDRPVALRADSITVATALVGVLMDAGVDVMLSQGTTVALVKRAGEAQSGTVAGKVTDAKSGQAIVGATVVVEQTSLSATTGNDGRYRITEVAPGTYMVRARYIGYTPGTASVTVSAKQESTADFALEKSAQQLNEVVTTGTLVPTEVKALPTPVSVISESDIALQRPRTIGELFRQAVPTAVSWDLVGTPYQTSLGVRGTSSMGGGLGGQLKVFIDGVEASSTSFTAIDPASIERMEVIRGPQAAAIYGSDALGGVIAVFTKHGDAALTRPQLDAQAGLGVIQTPYTDKSGALRQSYKASVRGGGSDISYNFGAGYSYTGDWLPGGQESAQSNPSIYGGMHFARGIISADVSGRYYVLNNPQVFDPALTQTGYSYYATPFFQPVRNENQTIGVRLSVAATRWWQHTVTVGLDRFTQEQSQTQPRLTSPTDTLLSLSNLNTAKRSIGYNTSVQGPLGTGIAGSLTAGFDHYSLPLQQWFTGGAVTTTGNIQTDPNQPVSVYQTTTNNTGYFAQAQLGFRDVLFLTAGIRAEQNTNFGDSLGTPISPRVGVSYARPLSAMTLKFRGSWGRSIRPPSPGQKAPVSQPGFVQLGNPALGPERQYGWDAGVDAGFGARGSLSVTYYDQTADNLIQLVQVQPVPVPTYQSQNVGRITNTGVEVEGTANVGPLEIKGQYGYTRSRIAQLNAGYTGDLAVGDQALITPKHTAGASLALSPIRGTTLAGGLTYLSDWIAYDNLGQLRCFAGTGPCQATLRDYHTTYPSMLKLNATVSQRVTPLISGFVSVDNLTNNQRPEVENGFVVMGRITTIGLQLHQ